MYILHSTLQTHSQKQQKLEQCFLQLVQTGQYDLPGGTFVRDSTMTSVRTWNELIRKEQCRERSMEYEERWDKIDHFIPLNPLQVQPHQGLSALFNQPWKSSQSPSQLSSWPQSSPGWSSVIETTEPKSSVTRSPKGRSKPVGETIEEKDPTLHEYHTHTQNTERKTMTTKQNKTKFRKSMRASLPVQSMGRGRVRCQWS